jgi:hypothetical protein
MSRFKEFLRKSESEMKAKKDSEETAAMSKAESESRLANLQKVEWDELAAIMKSTTEGEIFDGKPFFWVAPRMITLGDITLTTLEPREPYQKPTHEAHYSATALGLRPRVIRLTPTLKIDALRWDVAGLKDSQNISTPDLAEKLVEHLVDIYREIQSNPSAMR